MRRPPRPEERGIVREYLESERQRFAADKDDASKFVHVGVAPVDPALDQVQLAAFTSATAVVMNSPDAYSVH